MARYKNGRQVKVGDKVMCIGGPNHTVVGIVGEILPGEKASAVVFPITNGQVVTLSDTLHRDDVLEMCGYTYQTEVESK